MLTFPPNIARSLPSMLGLNPASPDIAIGPLLTGTFRKTGSGCGSGSHGGGFGTFWQFVQKQPSQYRLDAKHSQYFLRHRDFLHEQGLTMPDVLAQQIFSNNMLCKCFLTHWAASLPWVSACGTPLLLSVPQVLLAQQKGRRSRDVRSDSASHHSYKWQDILKPTIQVGATSHSFFHLALLFSFGELPLKDSRCGRS